MKVYAIHPELMPGPIPGMIGVPHAGPINGGTATEQADRVAGLLEHVDPSERSVYFDIPFAEEDKRPFREVLLHGYAAEHLRHWYSAFWTGLLRRECMPHLVIMDWEGEYNTGTPNTWQLFANNIPEGNQGRVEIMAAWYHDPAVFTRMPSLLKIIPPEAFITNNHDAFYQWNKWVFGIGELSLRSCVHDTMRTIFGAPATQSLVTNWNAINTRFQTYDANGWELPSVAPDTCSAPEIYSGWWNRPAWEVFVRDIDRIRACIGHGKKCIPWIGPHSWNGDGENGGCTGDAKVCWIADEVIDHACATGINEAILWNPEFMTAMDYNLMAAAIKRNSAVHPPLTLLPVAPVSGCVITGNTATCRKGFDA
jgi:hypothetical protein